MMEPVLDFFISLAAGLVLLTAVVVLINLGVKTAYLVAGSPTDKKILEEKIEQLNYCKMLVSEYQDKNRSLEKALRKANKELSRLRKEMETEHD